jgi:chemotaxis family two-component system response regulator PixH
MPDRLSDEPKARSLALRRILLVDDQPSIRGVLEMALAAAGADVWIADSGDRALQAVDQGLPDLILLDLNMPGMSGWEVLRALKASGRSAGIPVVLQSSARDYGSFDEARKQGVAAFLSKPYRLNEVVETCRRILGGARPLQGTPAEPHEERLPVQVRDQGNSLLAVGHFLDHSPSGALLELSLTLGLGQAIQVVFNDAGTLATRQAEVRWVRAAGAHYQHGLAFRLRG